MGETNNTNQNKSNGLLKFFLFVFFVIIVVLIVVNVMDNMDSEVAEEYGHLLSRSANNDDIIIDSDMDLSSMSTKFTLFPQADIDDLEITIKFLDDSKKVLYSTTKNLGNVKEGLQVTFSISLFELSFSTIMNVEYTSCSVSGGRVSYFS